jgi:hypothetical protein
MGKVGFMFSLILSTGMTFTYNEKCGWLSAIVDLYLLVYWTIVFLYLYVLFKLGWLELLEETNVY